MLVNTTPPNDAHKYDADDNLRLTEKDGYRDLVIAMIARAYKDSNGNTGHSSYMTLEKRHRYIIDALAFFKDGRCKHWLESIGITDEAVITRLRGR